MSYFNINENLLTLIYSITNIKLAIIAAQDGHMRPAALNKKKMIDILDKAVAEGHNLPIKNIEEDVDLMYQFTAATI